MKYKVHLTDSLDSINRVYSQFDKYGKNDPANGEYDSPAVWAVETALQAVCSFYNLLSLNARQNVEQIRCRHHCFS